MFPFFQEMRKCTFTLRYYDCFSQVHTAQSNQKGGQQGDPLEISVFNLIHHLWGFVLKQHPLARLFMTTMDI